MSLVKAISNANNKMHVVLSTTITTKESDEMIKTLKEEESYCDKINATIMVEITKTNWEKPSWMKYRYKISNITSNDSVSLEIKAKACQQEKKIQR